MPPPDITVPEPLALLIALHRALELPALDRLPGRLWRHHLGCWQFRVHSRPLEVVILQDGRRVGFLNSRRGLWVPGTEAAFIEALEAELARLEGGDHAD